MLFVPLVSVRGEKNLIIHRAGKAITTTTTATKRKDIGRKIRNLLLLLRVYRVKIKRIIYICDVVEQASRPAGSYASYYVYTVLIDTNVKTHNSHVIKTDILFCKVE